MLLHKLHPPVSLNVYLVEIMPLENIPGHLGIGIKLRFTSVFATWG
jgi:hypothetical protein